MSRSFPPKGRGALSQPDPRYLETVREGVDDGWPEGVEPAPPLRTTLTWEHPRAIINTNRSPDIPFEQSINPYRGCEHGCIYCYARPAHAYVDLSPGLDFESRLFAKAGAAARLREQLAAPAYRCSPIALGGNTDAYQPLERRLRVTREILEVLAETKHPVTIVTKSALVERDLDLLAPMAKRGLVQVYLSVTTLDAGLARRMEPRAAAPRRRLKTIQTLSEAGVPTGVMFAPVIPAINDHEMEAVLAAAAEHGAVYAGYVLLRLPREVEPLFCEWLENHFPLRAPRVLSLLRDLRAGKTSDAAFGTRLTGTGALAQLIKARFQRASREQGLNRSDHRLITQLFEPPTLGPQLDLFAQAQD